MSDKLKPCPFCGGEAELKLIGNNHTDRRYATINCKTFGCTVSMRVGAITNDVDWCVDKVTAKWNTRITEKEAVPE